MTKKLLLTSFQTWLPNQASNSSDDLLEIIQNSDLALDYLHFLQKLPVNTQLATEAVIKAIDTIQPQVIICCGMAAKRKVLTIESQAICKDQCLTTTVDLELLLSKLKNTQISYDAGKFVCEDLYYQVLNYIQTHNLNLSCIFVHVPLLNQVNVEMIVQDFIVALEYLGS